MVNLLTANACLSALKRDGIVYSKSYFSQMVSDGKIPSHPKPPSPKKFFYYDEVKQAIEDHKDPSRDAQREANEKRREEPTLLGAAGSYESMADITEEEKEEIKRIKEEVKREQDAAIAEGSINEDEIDDDGDELAKITGAAARAEKEYWLGQKAKIEYKRLKGEYISVQEVERQAFDTARAVRDAMLAIPPRIAPILASETDQFKIQRVLLEEINQALTGLSNEL